jgi:hypothetical protein
MKLYKTQANLTLGVSHCILIGHGEKLEAAQKIVYDLQ